MLVCGVGFLRTKSNIKPSIESLQRAMTYRMSFTNGSLFYTESLALVELYRQLGSWEQTKTEANQRNVLQARTRSSGTRNVHEICGRLSTLTVRQLDILQEGSRQDQIQILWLAACKCYQFIKEFASEVIREKFLHLDYVVSYVDYDVFFNSKAEWHEELEELSETTSKKLRQVVFRLAHEADILSSNDMINPAILCPEVLEAIEDDDPSNLMIFPISEAVVQEWSR